MASKKKAVKKSAPKSAKPAKATKAAPKATKPKKKQVVIKKKAAPAKGAKKKAAPKVTPAKKKAPAKKTSTTKKEAPAKKATPAKKTAPAKKAAPLKKSPQSGTSKAAPKPVIAEKGPKKKLTDRQKQFEKIREKLLKQKDMLLSEAETTMNALPEQTVFPDLGDQASAETDRNFLLRLRGREQRLINKIEEAMERINAGTFGICDSCGSEITFARLWARPVATLCIDCKTEQEEEERMQGQ